VLTWIFKESYHTKARGEGSEESLGTLRSATYSAIRNTIAKVSEISAPLRVTRKFATSPSGKPKWWFLLHADEDVLLILEENWEKVSLQTGWRLESCTRPSDASGTISVHNLNNIYNADATLSPMGDALKNGGTSAPFTPITVHGTDNVSPVSDPVPPVSDTIPPGAPDRPPKALPSAAGDESVVASNHGSATSHSDLQPFLDQQ